MGYVCIRGKKLSYENIYNNTNNSYITTLTQSRSTDSSNNSQKEVELEIKMIGYL